MRIWSPTETDRLLEGHAIGLTGSQLATYMGDGFNKNMVISKLDRLGLKLCSGQKAKRRAKPVPTTRVSAPPGNLAVICSNPKALTALLKTDCRFPITDDEPFLFCANPQRPNSPYCATHHAVAYRAVARLAEAVEQAGDTQEPDAWPLRVGRNSTTPSPRTAMSLRTGS